LYTITEDVVDNSFELNIPPFLGLHPVFNMALIRPYFPPLLDTLEIEEKLTPIEINPDCMQQESSDEIVDSRKVAHTGPNSVNISSSNRGTQRNGDHFFLMRYY
jgi:hypothetical protein